MTTYSRPGVFINEIALPQVIDIADNGSAVGVFIGALPKGPITPTLVSSWTEFVKLFGRPSVQYHVPSALYSFFANGGRSAYVVRSVGTVNGGTTVAPVKASVILQDATPANTLKVEAKDPGTWANTTLFVEVTSATATLFSLAVYESVAGSVNLVEQFRDLSLDVNNSRYAVATVAAGSKYINLIRTGYTGTVPAAAGIKSLSAGASAVDAFVVANGTVDKALVAANYVTALATLNTIETPLVINLPDVAYYFATGGAVEDSTAMAAMYANLIDYVDGRGTAFAVLDTPVGSNVAGATAFASAALGSEDGSNAAIYYPWITVADTLRNIPGATLTVPPGPSVVGQYLATDASRGVFKAPAGLTNTVALALGTERRFTNAELDTLNSAAVPVNAIRNVPGAGIAIMGGRTLRNTDASRYVNVRRTLIYLKRELEDRTAFAIFENNDHMLWNQIRSSLSKFLLDFWADGGLRGARPQDAFYVKCDTTTTSTTDIYNGQVNIEIGVALQYPAEFIVINLGQITGNATV
jgi:hypothetical protein